MATERKLAWREEVALGKAPELRLSEVNECPRNWQEHSCLEQRQGEWGCPVVKLVKIS